MNNEDKITLINTILQLEKSIDNDINNAFSEMNLSSESEFIKIAKNMLLEKNIQNILITLFCCKKII